MKYRIRFVMTVFVVHLAQAPAQEQGIINTARSPLVALKAIDIGDCQWTEGFWADTFKLCAEVMVPHMGSLLKGDMGHAGKHRHPGCAPALGRNAQGSASTGLTGRPDHLEGKVFLRGDQKQLMYGTPKRPEWNVVNTQFVPCFTWSNRGVSEMTMFVQDRSVLGGNSSSEIRVHVNGVNHLKPNNILEPEIVIGENLCHLQMK